MKQIFISRGKVTVEEVPAPALESGCVLVETAYSMISAGTEMSGLESSGESLFRKAASRPDRVRAAFKLASEQGLGATWRMVSGKLNDPCAAGYSISGIVLAVAGDVTGFKPGDAAACAGAGIANHAEAALVPRNLAVRIPEGCGMRDACSVAIGAIAMQGVRRAGVQIGDRVAVIGLGLIGQIATQLLARSGCHVIGTDISRDRARRALRNGAERTVVSKEENPVASVEGFTEGTGADCTLITAASASNEIIQQAMEMTRRKGRVVVLGAVGLGIKWSPFYEKEIDLLMSCSYGPGRYDPDYEQRGIDYPAAYVRWTENRNMEEYLRQIAKGSVRLGEIIEREYPVDRAADAFNALKDDRERPLGVIISYPAADRESAAADIKTRIDIQSSAPPATGAIGLAVVGAGSIAQAVHLPNIRKEESLTLVAVVDRMGNLSRTTAERFGAAFCATDIRDALKDDRVNAVLISTRHNTHAALACEALKSGAAVLCEKPMALDESELKSIKAAIEETSAAYAVGFNRRFSDAAIAAKIILDRFRGPVVINYRVNAGYIPADHWTHGPEGGGRAVGEACHMIDLMKLFTCESTIVSVDAESISAVGTKFRPDDNWAATLKFDNGSLGTLQYLALGSPALPKERIEIFRDGTVIIIDDFKTITVSGAPQPKLPGKPDKGHKRELAEFARAIRDGKRFIIPLESLFDTTRATFAIKRLVEAGK